jgi:phosphate uptake regulator
MRTAFHQQLGTLITAIAEMCALASRAMQDATQALLYADAALAERVIAEHDEIMFNAGDAEQDAIGLLALHAAHGAERQDDRRAALFQAEATSEARRWRWSSSTN